MLHGVSCNRRAVGVVAVSCLWNGCCSMVVPSGRDMSLLLYTFEAWVSVCARRDRRRVHCTENPLSFGAIRYGIDPLLIEQHTRQIKPVQVNSASQQSLRIGKIKGMNNRIISYSYGNTSAKKTVNN